jgi:PBP1b-binding outer membrane lipoprotein LpoB
MRRALSFVGIALILAACEDSPKQSVVPTQPTATASVVPTAVVPVPNGSTMCRVQLTSRDLAQASLKANPRDERAQARLTALDKIVADVCY